MQDNFLFPATGTDLLTANPSLPFTIQQLQAIQTGTLVNIGTVVGLRKGCIDWLRFESDKKLTYMSVDGTIYGISGVNKITNLNDFQEKLHNALTNGQRISFCYNTATNKMSMLNIYPCGCSCKKQ